MTTTTATITPFTSIAFNTGGPLFGRALGQTQRGAPKRGFQRFFFCRRHRRGRLLLLRGRRYRRERRKTPFALRRDLAPGGLLRTSPGSRQPLRECATAAERHFRALAPSRGGSTTEQQWLRSGVYHRGGDPRSDDEHSFTSCCCRDSSSFFFFLGRCLSAKARAGSGGARSHAASEAGKN